MGTTKEQYFKDLLKEKEILLTKTFCPVDEFFLKHEIGICKSILSKLTTGG